MSLDLLCAETLDEEQAMEDPILLQDRVLDQLLQIEHVYLPPSYKTVVNAVGDDTRTIVIKWMKDVCDDVKCLGAVFPSAVNYFDRYICKCQVPKQFLQLVACGCILIASKIRQNIPVHVSTFCYYSADCFTSHQLKEMESLISSTLNWDLASITAYDFIDLILHRIFWLNAKLQTNIRRYTVSLVHLCYASKEFHDLTSSVIATAAIIYAIQGCVPLSGDRLQYISSLTKSDLKLIHQTASKIEHVISKISESVVGQSPGEENSQ